MGQVIYPEWAKRASGEPMNTHLRDLSAIAASEQQALMERFGGAASGLITSLSIVAEHAEGGLKNVDEIRKRLVNHGYMDDTIEEVIGILEAPINSPFSS